MSLTDASAQAKRGRDPTTLCRCAQAEQVQSFACPTACGLVGTSAGQPNPGPPPVEGAALHLGPGRRSCCPAASCHSAASRRSSSRRSSSRHSSSSRRAAARGGTTWELRPGPSGHCRLPPAVTCPAAAAGRGSRQPQHRRKQRQQLAWLLRCHHSSRCGVSAGGLSRAGGHAACAGSTPHARLPGLQAAGCDWLLSWRWLLWRGVDWLVGAAGARDILPLRNARQQQDELLQPQYRKRTVNDLQCHPVCAFSRPCLPAPPLLACRRSSCLSCWKGAGCSPNPWLTKTKHLCSQHQRIHRRATGGAAAGAAGRTRLCCAGGAPGAAR